jgi:hypothetical protein
MACTASDDGMFDRLLRSEVAESVAAANHLDHIVGICEGTRGSGLSARELGDCAIPIASCNSASVQVSDSEIAAGNLAQTPSLNRSRCSNPILEDHG